MMNFTGQTDIAHVVTVKNTGTENETGIGMIQFMFWRRVIDYQSV